MADILHSAEVDELKRLLEEGARATEERVKRFIEPTQGALSRASSKRHHIVFGRRGSGKSSLLKKVEADLTIERTPLAYIDMEAFKYHEYPDVLISVLIKTFDGFREWLLTAAITPANHTAFWKKFSLGNRPQK